MRQNVTINRTAVDKILGNERPLSSMCREVGLAAVAAELQLQIDDLELDAAEAVERGAAALFLGGFSASPVASVAPSRTGKSGARKTRASTSVRRSRNRNTGKPTTRGK
jgi:hypothetical protein